MRLFVVIAAFLMFCSVFAAPRCDCSDVDPRDGYKGMVQFNCASQELFGNCNAAFMMETVEELPEGYCEITCGRCGCCSSLWSLILQDEDLTEYRDLASAVGFDQLLKKPGTMLTLLIPKNEAIQRFFLETYGFEWQALAGTDAGRKIITAILQQNSLIPEQTLDAVWTLPFMDGRHGGAVSRLHSRRYDENHSADQGDVWFSRDNHRSDVVAVRTWSGGVNVLTGDIEACKSIIHVTNWFLVPPEETWWQNYLTDLASGKYNG